MPEACAAPQCSAMSTRTFWRECPGPFCADGTWSISKFSLPPGLSLNGLTGQITGTPTTAGDYVFQVKYQSLGSNTKILSIHVDPAP